MSTWHASTCFRAENELLSYCPLSALPSPSVLTPPHLPHHSDSWKQNSSDLFCCFSLSQLPHSPHRSPVPLTVVIGYAGILQRLDIIYCLPCTIPPPTLTPFLNRTRCPADELIILEILFLLLIPPFYEQLLFKVQWMWPLPGLPHTSLCRKREGGRCGRREKDRKTFCFVFYIHIFLCLWFCLLVCFG